MKKHLAPYLLGLLAAVSCWLPTCWVCLPRFPAARPPSSLRARSSSKTASMRIPVRRLP